MGGLFDIFLVGEYGAELEGGWEDLRGISPLGREGVAGREEGGGATALGWESATWERCDWRGAGRAGRRGMLGRVSGGKEWKGQLETYSDKVDIQYTSVAGETRVFVLRKFFGVGRMSWTGGEEG